MLAKKPAKYAGEADLTSKPRKFGTYVPNVPAYLTCYRQFLHDVESKYHVPASDFTDFGLQLDISTFTQQTQQAIVQFKAAGVTTVLESCDPFFGRPTHPSRLPARTTTPSGSRRDVVDDQDPAPQTYDNAAEDHRATCSA